MATFPAPESMAHLIEILAGFTDYEKMESFHSGRIRCDLGSMQRLSFALGNPQHDLPCIHVTGSKGKGSVALMCAALLEASGLRCGVYTSPHLVRLEERITMAGRPLSEAAILSAADQALEPLRRDPSLRPTFFEFLTATAMVAFRDAGADVAVYEVGLGGRLDATNVVIPEASVITNVELEHTGRLGSTREAIAAEKAGIIKPGVPVATFLAAGDPARQPVEERAALCGSRLVGPGAGLELAAEGEGFRARVLGWTSGAFVPPRPAALQAGNAALALAAVHLAAGRGRIRLQRPLSASALDRLPLPGRFEILGAAPAVIVDGAHSAASLEATAREARSLAGAGPLVLLFGLAKDKDFGRCLPPVLAFVDEAVFTSYASPRSTDPSVLLAAAGGRGECAQSVAEGLCRARALAGPTGLVLVTGSFYCAGEARAILAQGARRGAGL